jgi:hypothetical protein
MGIAVKNSSIKLDNTIKRGNLALGMNNIQYGPSQITGFYSGLPITTNEYVIYETNSSGRLKMYKIANDVDLVNAVKKLGGSVSTTNEAISWLANDSRFFILDKPIDDIVTDGLALYLDSSQLTSYPKSGVNWFDLSDNTNNGTLVNGPTFNSNNGGIIVFDGVNDYANFSFNERSTVVNTVEMFVKWRSNNNNGMFVGFTSYDIWTAGGRLGFNTASSDIYGISAARVTELNLIGTTNSNWHHYVFVFTNQVQNNKIYIDANQETLTQQQGTTNLTATRTFPSTFRLSGWNNSFEYVLPADYSVVRIYNRELTSSEISQNYNATKNRFAL